MRSINYHISPSLPRITASPPSDKPVTLAITSTGTPCRSREKAISLFPSSSVAPCNSLLMIFFNHPSALFRGNMITLDSRKQLLNCSTTVQRLINLLIQRIIDGLQPLPTRLRSVLRHILRAKINDIVERITRAYFLLSNKYKQ